MKKVIVVVGYGPGISNAVAEKFGAEGFAVALVARNKERLDAGVRALQAKGIEAAAFTADAGKPEEIAAAIASAQKTLGPIASLQWTAYGTGGGDVTKASVAELRGIFDVPVVGLVTAVQAALPDLKAQKGSVLVTNGGLGFFDPAVDQVAVGWGAMGLAIANSAKHKLVGLLSVKLAAEGVYVGEVVVNGTVKGTAFDGGNATIEPASVANAFWKLQSGRSDVFVTVA
jgi:NAD(P)-dependent dehydrogenase (short-subunit alcohol dehydrogenase family)